MFSFRKLLGLTPSQNRGGIAVPHGVEPDSGARNRDERLCLVVNPRAGGGRAGQRLDELRRLADRSFEQWDLRLTEGPGHATELAREAVSGPFDIVAAVGGDGTCNEVVNGFFPASAFEDREPGDTPWAPTVPRGRQVVFTVIPLGTGSDLIRSLGIPRRPGAALWVASTGITLPVDVGWVRMCDPEGRPFQRAFVNVAGFGANGEVVARANRGDKRWGGTVTFLRATLETIANYRPQELGLTWSSGGERSTWQGPLTSAFVANGHHCGGGMWVGRGGSMFDGKLDLILLPPSGLLRTLRHGHRLYTGSLIKTPGVSRHAVEWIRAEPLERSVPPVRVDLDGEQPGSLPIDIAVVPGAVHVRGGWVRSPIATPEGPESPSS